jgi:hypothetical protein
MARQETGVPQLIHHYVHVVCALNEARKGAPSDSPATGAIEHSIVGVCELINSLVAIEHREVASIQQRASS